MKQIYNDILEYSKQFPVIGYNAFLSVNNDLELLVYLANTLDLYLSGNSDQDKLNSVLSKLQTAIDQRAISQNLIDSFLE